jgi:hypothetical protein
MSGHEATAQRGRLSSALGAASATFIASNTVAGMPTVTGFTDTFLVATGFMLLCMLMGTLVPRRDGAAPTGAATQPSTVLSAPEAAGP